MTKKSEVSLEFWRLPQVQRATGLGKTQIYDRMRETESARNPFPASYPYRHASAQPRARFWRSDEVQAWQRKEIEGLNAELSDLVG